MVYPQHRRFRPSPYSYGAAGVRVNPVARTNPDKNKPSTSSSSSDSSSDKLSSREKAELIGGASAELTSLIGGVISTKMQHKQELEKIKATARASKKTGKSDAMRTEAQAKLTAAEAALAAASSPKFLIPLALVAVAGIIGFVVVKVTSSAPPAAKKKEKKKQEEEEEEENED